MMRTVPLFPGSPEPSLDGPKAMKCLDESNFMEWSTSFRHYGRGMGQGQTSPKKIHKVGLFGDVQLPGFQGFQATT